MIYAYINFTYNISYIDNMYTYISIYIYKMSYTYIYNIISWYLWWILLLLPLEGPCKCFEAFRRSDGIRTVRWGLGFFLVGGESLGVCTYVTASVFMRCCVVLTCTKQTFV